MTDPISFTHSVDTALCPGMDPKSNLYMLFECADCFPIYYSRFHIAFIHCQMMIICGILFGGDGLN